MKWGALGVLLGLVLAALVSEGLGLSAFGPGSERVLLAMALSAGGGALLGLAAARRLLPGALVGAATACVLVRAPLPWTDLSVFGAGPAGALVVIALPVALGVAGAVAAAERRPA